MDLNSIPWDAFLNKEVGNLGALVALELNYLSSLFVVNKSAVACEFLKRYMRKNFTYIYPNMAYLLQSLQELLCIVLCITKTNVRKQQRRYGGQLTFGKSL